MLWLFNTASDRGRSRIDIFAVVIGLGSAFVDRYKTNGEIAVGWNEEAVGVTEQDPDALLAGCELDMGDPSKNCILEHISFENGVPVIPVAFMGKIATNLGADWKICEKNVELPDGSIGKQWYYCLTRDDYEKSSLYIDGINEEHQGRISAEMVSENAQTVPEQPQPASGGTKKRISSEITQN